MHRLRPAYLQYRQLINHVHVCHITIFKIFSLFPVLSSLGDPTLLEAMYVSLTVTVATLDECGPINGVEPDGITGESSRRSVLIT